MKKLLACMLCLVMVFPLWGCSEKGTVKKGETVSMKKVDTVLNDVLESQGEGNSLYKPQNQHTFLLCEITVKNTSSEDIVVSSMTSFTCYVDDQKTTISFPALENRGEKKQMDGTVKPGESLTGVLGYEVPMDWKKVKITYQPDLSNDKDTVTFFYQK